MKILNLIAIGIVALLSLAAGAAKLMQAPQEAMFFESMGLAPIFMTIIGAVQIAAGLLVLIPKLRKSGAILAALLFLISVAMILKTGQIGFALFSLLPVAAAIYVFMSSGKRAEKV